MASFFIFVSRSKQLINKLFSYIAAVLFVFSGDFT